VVRVFAPSTLTLMRTSPPTGDVVNRARVVATGVGRTRWAVNVAREETLALRTIQL